MPNLRLADKVAVVTGAGSGIGRAISLSFASEAAFVWVTDRDAQAAQATCAMIRQAGGRADAAELDVSEAEQPVDLSGRIGKVDILANVAGIGHVGSLDSTSGADLDRLHAVNVRGVLNCCKAFASQMILRKSGSVINMASVAGIIAVRDRLAYTVTKFAVVGMTKALALDCSHTGVRFNAICPGRVATPFVEARISEYPDPAKAYLEMASTQLLGRMITPQEVASAATYLGCDESAMITGSTLVMDGGWSIGK